VSNVVWWSSAGKRLHRDPNCPQFQAARRRAIQRFEAATMSDRDPVIYSYDFDEDNMTDGVYPPEHMMLCDLCGR
jgi:hypothetical protein